MQFEVLRRALWAQQAKPQTIFNWQFWERAAHDPKMTAYLNHGVKAKMCETTHLSIQSVHTMLPLEPRLNRPVTLYDSSSRVTKIGLSKVDVCADMTESPCTIVEALKVPAAATWSTMVMHTHPFAHDILQNVHPCHEVLLSCKPRRPGCHQWRPMQQHIRDDLKELQPDAIVEGYVDAKY